MEIEEENESDEEMESEDDNEIISEFEEGKINHSYDLKMMTIKRKRRSSMQKNKKD